MIEVTVLYPDGKEEEFRYDKTSIIIGRSAGNDIVLETHGVSRYHARLIVDGETVTVEDLGSTNGIFVDGQRVGSTQITKANIVFIGEAKLRVNFIKLEEEELLKPFNEIKGDSPLKTFPQISKLEVVSNSDFETDLTTAERGPENQAKIEENNEELNEHVNTSDEFYWQSLERFLSPIWGLITDDSVSEIMLNGASEIYFEKKGELYRSEIVFPKEQLKAAVLNIAQYVGRRVSDDEPYLDARLPDGSRVAVLMPPCSRKGIAMAIRKFSKEKLTIDKLLDFSSMSQQMVSYLKGVVELKKNIVISGGTSSGKTSLLNVISSLIPDEERVITIEDSAELQLSQSHVLPMETKPADKKGRGQVTIRDLVKASLRMRPDRIIVGEIRSGEALDLLQAMNTGHSGSMTTVHASSPRQALSRLETLALFSGFEIPVRALREQVSTAIDIIVQASRLPDHSRKVTHISEVRPLSENGEYQVQDIFRFVHKGREGAGNTGKIIGVHQLMGAGTQYKDEFEVAGMTEALNLFL